MKKKGSLERWCSEYISLPQEIYKYNTILSKLDRSEYPKKYESLKNKLTAKGNKYKKIKLKLLSQPSFRNKLKETTDYFLWGDEEHKVLLDWVKQKDKLFKLLEILE